ncbi:hypothetical protein DFH28DRAFT_827349, partial [Melampsora americana]
IHVQHNCHNHGCQVELTKQKTLTEQIQHTENTSYIVNLASLYSLDIHLCAANIPSFDLTPKGWDILLESCMNEWVVNKEKNANQEKEKEKAKLRNKEDKS